MIQKVIYGSLIMAFTVTATLVVIFLLSWGYSTFAKPSIKTERPIIGILAETTHGLKAQFGKFYIAASYVKFIESAGGRAVAILPNATSDDIEKVFKYINGVLFPGGGVDLTKSGYARHGNHFYNLSIKAYEEGVIFPIWGACLGYELLNVITSNDKVTFSHLDAEDLPSPLIFQEGFKDSKMFGKLSDEMTKAVQDSSITMNNHQWGVTPENFQKNSDLNGFYNILSTNKDRNGKVYVSSIEGRKYPVFGVQWHPEKNQFEWSATQNTPHSSEAVQLGQYMSNIFVGQARLNDHKFPSQEEEAAALIYNYSPVYTQNFSNFTQIYFF